MGIERTHMAEMDLDVDYYGGDYLQDIVETALIEVGGQALLNQAHEAAGAYVDRHYPWDGAAAEPTARVSAYCAVLAAYLQAARP